MRRPLVSLLVILICAIGGLGLTEAADNEVALGLDLQGGVAIVLEPDREVDSGVLDQSIEIIRNRVDALGVAEPEITRQGDNIVVQLPGVTDTDRAREIVGATAELRFRPVLQVLPGADFEAPEVDPSATTTTTGGDDGEDDGDGEATTTTGGGDGDDEATTTTGAGDQESSLGDLELIAAQGEPTTTTAAGDEPDQPPATTATTIPPAGADGLPELTPREEDELDATVVLPELDEGREVLRYVLGPTEMRGDVVASANARFQLSGPGWQVEVDFTSEGASRFDEMAAEYVGRQVAIVLDGVVVSAPTIQAEQFGGTAIISGGGEAGFSEGEAKDLALVLRFGSLPVQLEPQAAQEVSATLGRDALDAGITAGLVGIALVALFVIAYYRLLGVTMVLSLLVAGLLLWTIVAWLSASQGLALTLAGATGIIVSIGVAADSNIVYYERIKEEVRSGRTLRSSVEHAFNRSFSTILKADAASLIGAGLLYWLTVGPVRGFALFLGISTLLDLVVSWFFMRPAAIVLSRSRFGRARWLGLPEGARP